MDDPKLARQLARGTWVVLVAAFVMLTRFPFEPMLQSGALAGVIAVCGVLNAPVVIGLSKTRAQSGHPAWRAVALAFGFRVIGLVAVVVVVSTR